MSALENSIHFGSAHDKRIYRRERENTLPLTKINWAKYTFNPWHGCTKVSAGCDHCYAESLDRRHLHSREYHWGPGVERQVMGDHLWLQPIAWNESEANADARPRVFCASMADWADVEAPAGQREKLWELIRKTPNLDWLLLTKRPQNIRMYSAVRLGQRI